MDNFTKFSKIGEKCFGGAVHTCALILCLLMVFSTQHAQATGSLANNATVIKVQSISIIDDFRKILIEFKEKVFGKEEPDSIRVQLKNHVLEIKMDNVPQKWKGKIVFEDKSGYDSYQQNFGYKNMNQLWGSYKYTISTDKLPHGTYDIKIYNQSGDLLFTKNNVVLD